MCVCVCVCVNIYYIGTHPPSHTSTLPHKLKCALQRGGELPSVPHLHTRACGHIFVIYVSVEV